MLRSILIENYALIDNLDIDFRKGLTIITGETGAGKSILLGALGMLLGKRADSSVLKSQEKKCVVEGVFHIEGYGLEIFFTNNELDYHPETIIRREILNTGKTRAFVNDTPVNLNILQDLTVSLIDIHSQHQNLQLNNEAYLLQIIDQYARTGADLSYYSTLFYEYITLKKIYEKLVEEFENFKREQDYIEHQYRELESAKLGENELEILEQENKQLAHAEELKTAFQSLLLYLKEDESSILSHLKFASDLMQRIHEHSSFANEVKGRLDNCYIDLKDIASESEAYFEKLDMDPERMIWLNDRLGLIHGLLRKFKCATTNELLALKNELQKKVLKLEKGDIEISALFKELKNKEKLVIDYSIKLSEIRRSKFKNFEMNITETLGLLGMKEAVFSIRHEKTELSPSGIDRIQFMFSANKNLPTQNISKVASGGELSRLMLAVKHLISNSTGLPTIIFDEIDTGVSGEIADKMGKIIQEMAGSMQVICITHLPQVASKGNDHFQVYKNNEDGITKTFMRELNPEDRLLEIAKMLSGDSLSDAAMANARVLLNQ